MMASSLKNSQLNLAAATLRSEPSVRLASPTAPARSSARVWSSVTARYSAGAAFQASRLFTMQDSARRASARQGSAAASLPGGGAPAAAAPAAAARTSWRMSAAHSGRSLKSLALSAPWMAARDVCRVSDA